MNRPTTSPQPDVILRREKRPNLGQMLIRKNHIKLLIFSKTEEVIVKWNS